MEFAQSFDGLIHQSADLIRAGLLNMNDIERVLTPPPKVWVTCTRSRGHQKKHIDVCERCSRKYGCQDLRRHRER